MELLDWLVVAGYFLLLLGLAWWVILQSKDTADDYFLAGRNLGWFIVGASIFASNIGSEHLVGLAGSGCTDGVAMAHYELHAWCLLVLAWVFVPFYMRSHGLHHAGVPRAAVQCHASRWVLSIISLVAYVLTKIAVGIFAGGVVFAHAAARTASERRRRGRSTVSGSARWSSFVLTGLYTVLGGMRAVAYTEALQTIILIIGSALVTVYGLQALGGWGELRTICRLGDVQSLEAAGSRRHGGHLGAGQGTGPDRRWYFNDNYPVAGHAVLRADHRAVVLVHRPVHRAAGAGRTERTSRPGAAASAPRS